MLPVIITIMSISKFNVTSSRYTQAGVTLPEVMVASVLLAVFFASIFELNAICLRYIDASKESVAALQSVHDRTETLRNLAFRDLVSPTYVSNLLLSPPNASNFSSSASEVVKITAFPTANGVTQFSRAPSGTVTLDSTAADLGTGLVQVDVAVSWNMTLGGRPRRESTTTIVSNGTKK